MGYSHGKQWTDEKIFKSVDEIINWYGLDRMPSKSEVEKYCNDTSLSNAISKRWGFYGLAKILGLEVKQSETKFGKMYEEIVMDKLVDIGFKVERMSVRFPYDLFINKSIKVDVKVSRIYKGPSGDFYTFNIEKPFATCDIFVLLCLCDEDEITREYIVPSVFVPENTQISIGNKNSKYSRFLNRWDYFDIYNNFTNQLLIE